MRLVKRCLIFAREVGVFLAGIVLFGALSIYLGVLGFSLAEFVFYFGVLLTCGAFFAVRQKARAWKIRYDAVGYHLSQTERRLHPTRFKYKRLTRRVLIWLPSAIAAFTLFLFPVASHLIYPPATYVKHFSVPIPWTATVLRVPYGEEVEVIVSSSSSRHFGETPFWPLWRGTQLLSLMSFQDTALTSMANEFGLTTEQMRHRWGRQASSRNFRLGDAILGCGQPVSKPNERWAITCAPAELHDQNFYATFYGRMEDIPTFYNVIEGVAPVK